MAHKNELSIKGVVSGARQEQSHWHPENVSQNTSTETYPSILLVAPILLIYAQFWSLILSAPKMDKSDRCFITAPLVLFFPFYF